MCVHTHTFRRTTQVPAIIFCLVWGGVSLLFVGADARLAGLQASGDFTDSATHLPVESWDCRRLCYHVQHLSGSGVSNWLPHTCAVDGLPIALSLPPPLPFPSSPGIFTYPGCILPTRNAFLLSRVFGILPHLWNLP